MEVMMRRAKRADAEAINFIYNQAIDDGNACMEIDHCTLERRLEWMGRHNKRFPIYVGECEGRIICWVALSQYREGYAYDGVVELSVFVERSMRHQGLGSMLLKFVERQAVKLGHHKILFGVYASNIAALHVYRRHGYRDVGVFRNHGYHKGRLHDIIYMERLLPVKIEEMNQYYFDNYACYQQYFQELQLQLEEQMQRNGMVRSAENPDQWVPEEGEPNYIDDWNGMTVRPVKTDETKDKIPHTPKSDEVTPLLEDTVEENQQETAEAGAQATADVQEHQTQPAAKAEAETDPEEEAPVVAAGGQAVVSESVKQTPVPHTQLSAKKVEKKPSAPLVEKTQKPAEQKVAAMAGAAPAPEQPDPVAELENMTRAVQTAQKPEVFFDLFAEDDEELDHIEPIGHHEDAPKEKKGFFSLFFRGKKSSFTDDNQPMDNQLMWSDVFGGNDSPDDEN